MSLQKNENRKTRRNQRGRLTLRGLAVAGAGAVLATMMSAAPASAAKVTPANDSANVATARSQAAEDVYFGCPSGAVCIYARDDAPGAQPDPDKITNIYWSYGAHNLSNQVGMHWLVNNQVPRGSNAWVSTCTGYNGVNCTKQILPYMGIRLNFDPINSIVLHRP
ncbi:hypothetical protein ACIBU0_33335 [Streptomyces sp. NPDC049627]|uniref:hypothetical protein n=1 Tax=Streptomyces sp. NPDC049627 TaxID=3365595 RepID=UPI003788602C